MEIKTLQREIMDADRLAERGRMIIELNEKLVDCQQENAALGAKVAELENQLKSATSEVQDGSI